MKLFKMTANQNRRKIQYKIFVFKFRFKLGFENIKYGFKAFKEKDYIKLCSYNK